MAEIKNFDKVYLDFWDRVFRLCMGYTGNEAWAKDLSQETFVLVWQNLDKFREESQLSTWIYRIATNHCLRQVEKDKKQNSAELPTQHEEESSSESNTELELLHRFISELPETDRIIITLELEEVKQSEIAQILGLSEGNIRVRIHRIKERLTQRFKENGY